MNNRVKHWEYDSFPAFYNTLPRERREKDEKRLERLFNIAALVPQAQEALTWGRDHGVRYFLDYTLNPTCARYTTGTGVVSLSAQNTTDAAGIIDTLAALTHETYHAWQDCNLLVPAIYPDTPFLVHYVSECILEASARAVEKRAEWEGRIVHGLRTETEAPSLWQGFKEFFTQDMARTTGYGRDVLEAHARSWGLPVETDSINNPPVRTGEFNPPFSSPAFATRLSLKDLLQGVGKTFNDAEYYDKKELVGLSRMIMDNTLAARFYDAGKKEPDHLVQLVMNFETQQSRRNPFSIF